MGEEAIHLHKHTKNYSNTLYIEIMHISKCVVEIMYPTADIADDIQQDKILYYR